MTTISPRDLFLGPKQQTEHPPPHSPSPSARADPLSTQPQEPSSYKATVSLCVFAFLLSFKPSEPFLVPYLIENKGFTTFQIKHHIFPIWTYAYFISLIFMGPVAEKTKYKHVIIFGIACRIFVRFALLFGQSLFLMQAVQVAYGCGSSAETILRAYVFCVVPRNKYRSTTSAVYSSLLAGHVASAFLGQYLVDRDVQLTTLLYISAVSVTSSILIPILFFKRPEVSIFNKASLRAVSSSFVSPRVSLWSLWFIFALAADNLVQNYATALFAEIDWTVDYNGAVTGAALLGGTLASLLASRVPDSDSGQSDRAAYAITVVFTCLSGVCLGYMGHTTDIYHAYGAYIVYVFLIKFLIALCCARIALALLHSYFALFFSLITVASIGAQSILQLGLQRWDVDVRIEYYGFALYQIALGLAFLLFLGASVVFSCCNLSQSPSLLSKQSSSSKYYSMSNNNGGLPINTMSADLTPRDIFIDEKSLLLASPRS